MVLIQEFPDEPEKNRGNLIGFLEKLVEELEEEFLEVLLEELPNEFLKKFRGRTSRGIPESTPRVIPGDIHRGIRRKS